jgi:flagellar basal body-associated protein FliL
LADAKDPKTEEPAPEAKKKGGKRLLPVLMVLVGAVVGGAGVVVLGPKPVMKEHGPPPKDVRLYDHPQAMEFTINPVVERGHKTAMIHFLFTYKADAKDVTVSPLASGEHGKEGEGAMSSELPPVLKSIQANWNRAYSRCLEVLSNQKAADLLDPEGKRALKRTLIDELSASLFPDGIATVDDILWQKYFVQ